MLLFSFLFLSSEESFCFSLPENVTECRNDSVVINSSQEYFYDVNSTITSLDIQIISSQSKTIEINTTKFSKNITNLSIKGNYDFVLKLILDENYTNLDYLSIESATVDFLSTDKEICNIKVKKIIFYHVQCTSNVTCTCDELVTDHWSIVNFKEVEVAEKIDFSINETFSLSAKTLPIIGNGKVVNATVTNLPSGSSIQECSNEATLKIGYYKLLFTGKFNLSVFSIKKEVVYSLEIRYEDNITSCFNAFLQSPSTLSIRRLTDSFINDSNIVNKIFTNSSLQVEIFDYNSNTVIYSSSDISLQLDKNYPSIGGIELLGSNQTLILNDIYNATMNLFSFCNATKISSRPKCTINVYNLFIKGDESTELTAPDLMLHVYDNFYIDELNITFSNISFGKNAVLHQKYGLNGKRINAVNIAQSPKNIIAEYTGTKMPTDAEFAPFLKTEHYLICSEDLECSSTKFSHIDDPNGVVGFTKDTDITEPFCETRGKEKCFGFKFMEYPTRVYPHFCYAAEDSNMCDDNSFIFQNISETSMSDYITSYTKQLTVSLYADMLDSDVFDFDTTRKPKQISVTGRSSTKSMFNMKFSEETRSSVRSFKAENVQLNFIPTGSTNVITIPKMILNNVVIYNKEVSFAGVDQLIAEISVLETLPSNGITNFYLDIGDTRKIYYNEKQANSSVSNIWEFEDINGSKTPFMCTDVMNPVITAKQPVSISLIKNAESNCVPIIFSYLSDIPLSEQSMNVTIYGDWGKEIALQIKNANAVNLTSEASFVPVKFYCSSDVTLNCLTNETNSTYFTAQELPDKANLAFTFGANAPNFLLVDSCTSYGSGSLVVTNSWKTNRSAILYNLTLSELSTFSIKGFYINANFTIPYTTRLQMNDCNLSDTSLTLIIKLEDSFSKLTVENEYSMHAPKKVCIIPSLDQLYYQEITENYYTKSIYLISSQTKSLDNWENKLYLSTTRINCPATPIDISVKTSSTMVIVTFNGYAPDISPSKFTIAETIWIAIGALFVAILVGYGIVTLYKKYRNHQQSDDNNIGGNDDIFGEEVELNVLQ